MTHLVIGIHGFARKPPKEKLEQNWRAALQEGLLRNSPDSHKKELEGRLEFDFELVYWADQLYEEPLLEDPEPYRPAEGKDPLPYHDDDWVDELVADVIDAGESLLDRAMLRPRFHQKTQWLLDRMLRDSERYNQDRELRRIARDRLDKLIRDAAGERSILLLGHSMGSVISYEVLRHLEQDFSAPVVDHFIAMGSPLGFPYLTRYLELRHGNNRVPHTTARWSNLADRRDWAAIDAHLRDDFHPNSLGVKVEDDLVINNYLCPQNLENRHKSYGYLRTPEMSRRVAEFLLST